MKKYSTIIVLLLISLLLCVTAQAVEWEQYAVPGGNRVEYRRYYLDNGDEIVLTHDFVHQWIRNGEIIAELSSDEYPDVNSLARFISLPDGNCGVLLKSERDEQFYIAYAIWSAEELNTIVELVADNCWAVLCPKGFLIADEAGNASLYDYTGQFIWQGTLGNGLISRPYGLEIRTNQDWSCAMTEWTGKPAYMCARYVNGEVIWVRQAMRYSFCTPLADGWSLITEYRSDGQNGPTYLSLIDPNGDVSVSRHVSADRLSVTSNIPIQMDDGTIIIFGRGVGNRRGIYLVWKLCLDSRMNFISLDVRDCSYHNCYSIAIYPDDQGSARIHLTDLDLDDDKAPDVLVPFEVLPVVMNHTLQYEWGSPADDSSIELDGK